jgi:hypothetical protein
LFTTLGSRLGSESRHRPLIPFVTRSYTPFW